MGLQNCQILLDNSWNTYYAGQTITGRFVLNVDKEKKVRGESKAYNYIVVVAVAVVVIKIGILISMTLNCH